MRANIDELFEYPAPCALRRQAAAWSSKGEPMKHLGRLLPDGTLENGINSGVMVVEPCTQVFQHMLSQLNTNKFGLCSNMPEQDFLTIHFRYKWHALGVEYSFQQHQLAFTNRAGLEIVHS